MLTHNPTITLHPGREKSLLRRHPWVLSGAIARVDGNPAPGATVDIFSADGKFLARAAFSPSSQIRARAWTFDPSENVDSDFFRRQIKNAIASRNPWLEKVESTGFRLIYAESDGLPGLIVDRYGETLVLQSLTAGSEYWKETLVTLLLEATGLAAIFERSDADVRELEGLSPCIGPLRGTINPQPQVIKENGLQFLVNLETGHKTGFYLDQRFNRQIVRRLSNGRSVLDCFSYTGGFTVNALAGGAVSVLSVDASADALSLCRENCSINNLPLDRHAMLEGDVFQLLRKFRDEARTFDLIVLDPPKFAPTAALAERAARGYKDINLLAFKLLNPSGILVTFSCSGGVDAGLFQKIVASAALDAGVQAQIVEHLSQAADHPVALNFPEGSYLKGLICIKA
jgi:23S rRNA (cytosine1962-C5)-methyltransferase